MFSFIGKVEIIKSVIKSMLIHSMAVWPISLVRDIVCAIKRSIWSSEATKIKVITVAWKTMCLPLKEGDLGLRSLVKLNEGFKLKLVWYFLNSTISWTVLLRTFSAKVKS